MSHDSIAAGFDPAFQRDACAGVVVRCRGDLFEVCAVWERRPAKGAPLVPSETVKAFGAVAIRHGARQLVSDVHYQESVKEHLPRELSFVSAPGGNAGKAEVYGAARELIHAGRVKWSAGHTRLTQQMREIIARPLPGGLIAITSPRRKGAHGDIASACCLALWAAAGGHGDTLLDALRRLRPGELDERIRAIQSAFSGSGTSAPWSRS